MEKMEDITTFEIIYPTRVVLDYELIVEYSLLMNRTRFYVVKKPRNYYIQRKMKYYKFIFN